MLGKDLYWSTTDSDSNEFEDGWLEGTADLLFSSLLIPNDLLQGDLTGRSFTELAQSPPLVIPKYRSKLNPTKRHHSTGATHDQGEAVISWYASNFVNRYVHKGSIQRQWPARERFRGKAEDQTPETNDRVSNWTGLLD